MSNLGRLIASCLVFLAASGVPALSARAEAQLDQNDYGLTAATEPAEYLSVVTNLQEVAALNSPAEIDKITDMRVMFSRSQTISGALARTRATIAEIDENISKGKTYSKDKATQDYIAQIMSLDCETIVSPTARFRLINLPDPLRAQATGSIAQCESLKKGVDQPGSLESIRRVVEAEAKENETNLQQFQDTRVKAEKVASDLRTSVSYLEGKIDDGIRNINSVSSLPWIVGSICVFCLAILFFVKQFDGPVQIEWVSTGQATQFVTIILLLSLIAMLAINGRIGENTLGTLLGGVAGYVLAQGVGRSTARQAERQVLADEAQRRQQAAG